MGANGPHAAAGVGMSAPARAGAGARRHGRRRHDARRPHAGAGRSAPDRAGADRRAAAPRLRDHQGARGQDRRLVLAQPGHRLSDAHLSRGGGLRHRPARGRQEALHHHRRGPRASRGEPRFRRRRARAARRHRREGYAHAPARSERGRRPRAGRAFRRWCARRSTTCARSRPSASKTTPMRKPRWSRCWCPPRRNCVAR